MRRALVLILCLSDISWSAPALISHITCAGNPCTTTGINTTGATLLIICNKAVGSGGTVSDSKSNSWTGLTAAQAGATNPFVKIFYVNNPTTDTSQTFTGDGYGIFAAAFNGTTTTSPFDQQNGHGTGSGVSFSEQPGSITPTVDGELLLTCLGGTMMFTPAIDSGFNVIDTQLYDGSTMYGGGLASLVQGTAAAINPTWSWGDGANDAAVIASFKAGAATAATCTSILGGGIMCGGVN